VLRLAQRRAPIQPCVFCDVENEQEPAALRRFSAPPRLRVNGFSTDPVERALCVGACTGFAPPQTVIALAAGAVAFHEGAMIPKSPLDDPHKAAHAWARYRRIMRWMMTVTVGLVIASVILLYRENGMVSVHYYIATALGVGFTMLLASALMGLVFLSSGTGHDEAIIDPLDEDRD